MNDAIKEKLKKILHNAFKGSWELGGGAEFRYKHGVEVAEFALKIAKAEKLNVDYDALYVAGLFHDIGKVKAINESGEIDYESDANKNHENTYFKDLKKYIGSLVDDALIQKSADIIREELNDNSSLERKVLKDADELGNFGYLQVWRTFNYTALTKQTFEQMLQFWESGNLEERKKWIDQLYFDTSKKVALKRYNRFANFIKTIKEESHGDDIVSN